MDAGRGPTRPGPLPGDRRQKLPIESLGWFQAESKRVSRGIEIAPIEPITPVSSHSHFRFRFNSNGNLRDICQRANAFRDPNGAGPAATRSGQGRLALVSLPERATERNRSRTAPVHEPADLLLAISLSTNLRTLDARPHRTIGYPKRTSGLAAG